MITLPTLAAETVTRTAAAATTATVTARVAIAKRDEYDDVSTAPAYLPTLCCQAPACKSRSACNKHAMRIEQLQPSKHRDYLLKYAQPCTKS